MPNAMDKYKIIERLQDSRETRLMRYDLEKMLEEELSKTASEVDGELVQELLDMMNEEVPSEEKENSDWKRIEKQLKTSNRKRSVVLVQRVAASVVILTVLFVISLGTAQAIRMGWLMKLLQPVAETFGLYSANNPNPDSESLEQDDFAYTIEESEYTQAQYDSLADFPTERSGYKVQPAWMPERFSFVQGSLYDDGDMAVLMVIYNADGDFFNLTTTFFSSEEDVSAYEYERTLLEPISEIISGKTVTYYYNRDEQRLSVSWIDQNVHYFMTGDVSEVELRQIIGSMIEP